MNKRLLRIVFWAIVICGFGCIRLPTVNADTVPAGQVQGFLHGFLEIRSEDGVVVGSGEITQVARGGQFTSRTFLRFNNGSIDDETTVFSQHRTLHLIKDHHVQRGPSFPQSMDVSIDTRSGQVTVRSKEKGKDEKVTTDHLDLPPDLMNGLVPVMIQNLASTKAGATVSMVVTTPKPRLVKLELTPVGEDTCSIVGVARKALHYEIKIKLGGIAGVVAPLIGKAPPNIQVWAIGGEAPTMIREDGPLYQDGPVMRIQLASPAWPKSLK